MRKNVILLTLLCFWAVSIATVPVSAAQQPAAEPSWVNTGGVKEFPADSYITGVGSAVVTYNDSAAAQAEADAKAIAQVAKQIEVVINQLSSSFEREVSSSGRESRSQSDIWQKTAAFVKIKIEGVRIEDRYFDQANNRIYALALFDRVAQGSMISNQIATLRSNAAALIQEAEKSRRTIDKLYRAVAAYGLAVNKMILALRQNQYLSVIAPRMVHRDIPDAIAELQMELTDFLSMFTFEKIDGDNQQGVVSGNLNDPLRVSVGYQGQPVPSLPITFAFVEGSGNIDAYARTDSHGIAATTVSNLGPTGKKINKIRSFIDIYPSDAQIQKELTAVIPPVYAQFTYFLPAVEDTRIAIVLNEYNLGKKQSDSYLANRIVQTLSQSKLKIVKNIPAEMLAASYDINGGPEMSAALHRLSEIADIAIMGEVKATTMDGAATEGLVFSRARAMVKIFDLASQTEIANVDFATKSAGPSREESGRRALKKISSPAAEQVSVEVQRTLFGK
jgi:hypothetical protein